MITNVLRWDRHSTRRVLEDGVGNHKQRGQRLDPNVSLVAVSYQERWTAPSRRTCKHQCHIGFALCKSGLLCDEPSSREDPCPFIWGPFFLLEVTPATNKLHLLFHFSFLKNVMCWFVGTFKVTWAVVLWLVDNHYPTWVYPSFKWIDVPLPSLQLLEVFLTCLQCKAAMVRYNKWMNVMVPCSLEQFNDKSWVWSTLLFLAHHWCVITFPPISASMNKFFQRVDIRIQNWTVDKCGSLYI